MAIPVLILGESGSGKTYSIRNLDPATTGILSVEKGRLPFRGDFKVVKNATYSAIEAALKRGTMKTYIIDDAQYLMVNEEFDRFRESGYTKYAEMALNFRNLIHMVNKEMPDSIVVYFLHHTQTTADGTIKAKTIGKMIDDKLTLEGCFDIVLMAKILNGEHVFQTKGEVGTTVKSPVGMFETDNIPNDLAIVSKAIADFGWLENNA